MRHLSSWLLAAVVSVSMSGCFLVSKDKTGSSSEPVAHKNRGQERKAEVHERNAERKADKDADKANKGK